MEIEAELPDCSGKTALTVGGGDFLLACEESGERFNNSFPPALFIALNGDQRPHQFQFSFFRSGSVHRGSASWYDCGQVFPNELHVSLFPDRFPLYAWTVAQSAHFNFIGSSVYACLGVICHLHFWQNDRGLLYALLYIVCGIHTDCGPGHGQTTWDRCTPA